LNHDKTKPFQQAAIVLSPVNEHLNVGSLQRTQMNKSPAMQTNGPGWSLTQKEVSRSNTIQVRVNHSIGTPAYASALPPQIVRRVETASDITEKKVADYLEWSVFWKGKPNPFSHFGNFD
jgi:hypothetical protein